MATVITYPLSDHLIESCPDAGWIIAAIEDDQVIALKEFHRLDPQVSYDLPARTMEAAAAIRRWLDTLSASAVVDELQQLGRIAVGMCHQGSFFEV